MPVQNGPGCATGNNCPVLVLPQAPAKCYRSLAKGGVNDIYVIPCGQTMSETNVLSLSWYQTLLTGNLLGNLGIGAGKIGKKATSTEKIGSETTAELTDVTWALTYVIKNIDKTSDDVTTEQVNLLINNAPSFLMMARMSDGDDSILPIGPFVTSDFDWTVPDDSTQLQTVTMEFSWHDMGKPKVYTVAGLSAILPKSK